MEDIDPVQLIIILICTLCAAIGMTAAMIKETNNSPAFIGLTVSVWCALLCVSVLLAFVSKISKWW